MILSGFIKQNSNEVKNPKVFYHLRNSRTFILTVQGNLKVSKCVLKM